MTQTITSREELFEFLIEVEISPKVILKHKIKNDYISYQLNSMLELYLLDEDYDRKDFNSDLLSLTKYVRNKVN